MKMIVSLAAVVLHIALLSSVGAYPTGAPNDKDVCKTMKPGHSKPPQASMMPFTITTNKNTYDAGDVVLVYINATGPTQFKGFLIQARRAGDKSDQTETIGYFKKEPNDNTIQDVCAGTYGNGLTHTSAGSQTLKSHLVLQWEAPDTPTDHIRFWATVVSDVDHYWVAETSDIVAYPKAGPIPTTPPRRYEDIPLFAPINGATCGDSKSCYRNPENCKDSDCDIIVTWRESDDRNYIDFELGAYTQGWVAVGFSDDKKMGEDDVIECVWNEKNKEVEIRMSFNKNSGKSNEVLSDPQLGLLNGETDKNDYRIECRVRRDKREQGGMAIWDDLEGDYHILMAKGEVDNEGNKKRHDLEPGKHPYVSKNRIRLYDTVDIHGTARYWLVKFHGCLMIIAWMMCCTTAILLAKYYKPMWPNDELCGTDVWFAVHRGLQCVTLGCTVLGFILIFIHAGGYSQMPELPDKAHPILGIIVTIFCILNPLLSICRCSPKSDYRPVFNWLHWFFGTLAAVLSMPTLFIGLNLHKAFVPWWATWVMVAFMLFHLVVELMLEIHGCINSKKQRVRNEEYEMRKKGDHRGDYYRLEPEPVGTRFKKRTLAIYLCVVIICGLIMVITIAVS